MNNSIIFEVNNKTGIVKLNRPEALNALDLEMASLFFEKLKEWNSNKNIERILLKGQGKAFCAGGDVKSLFGSSIDSQLKKNFFNKEYKLNYMISKFKKPYLSIWDGIVMGGGVGLSIYGNLRIATENTKFAMPETAIGFFPDVGASYFLSRLKKKIGVFLGLTGQVVSANEVMQFGLATHYFDSSNLSNVIDHYIKKGSLPISENITVKKNDILHNLDFIENVFNGTIKEIFEKLQNSNSDFAKNTLKILKKRCPMSMLVTLELLKKARSLSLKECLEMEYQLSQHIVYRDDFNNGVENVLIKKVHDIGWKPSSIDDINQDELIFLFETHVEKLGL